MRLNSRGVRFLITVPHYLSARFPPRYFRLFSPTSDPPASFGFVDPTTRSPSHRWRASVPVLRFGLHPHGRILEKRHSPIFRPACPPPRPYPSALSESFRSAPRGCSRGSYFLPQRVLGCRSPSGLHPRIALSWCAPPTFRPRAPLARGDLPKCSLEGFPDLPYAVPFLLGFDFVFVAVAARVGLGRFCRAPSRPAGVISRTRASLVCRVPWPVTRLSPSLSGQCDSCSLQVRLNMLLPRRAVASLGLSC